MTVTTPADYLAICDTKARYCRCLDTKDWAGFADCFTEDLVLDTTPSGGYRVEGRDAAVGMVSTSLATTITAHQVHNPEVHVDGDEARVIWAMQDRLIWSADKIAQLGSTGMTGFGHYHERYVRCPDGKWRIAEQTLTRLHVEMHKG